MWEMYVFFGALYASQNFNRKIFWVHFVLSIPILPLSSLVLERTGLVGLAFVVAFLTPIGLTFWLYWRGSRLAQAEINKPETPIEEVFE